MAFRKILLRVGMTTVLGLVLVAPAVKEAAAASVNYAFAPSKDVIITEVQTGGLASAGEEFIELFNNTDADIDLADTVNGGKNAWKLQYFSKTKLSTLLPASETASGWTSPFRTISLTGVIPAGDYYVVAGTGYVPGSIDPDQTYTSTLADDGGALQLVDVSTVGTNTNYIVHDRLAWSTDTSLPANSLLYGAPGAGASLQRLPNEDDEYLGADGTLTAFVSSGTITPKNVWQAPVVEEPPVPEPEAQASETDGDGTPEAVAVSNEGLSAPILTELLANPASPRTDAADEYIELYNPNEAPFNLKGYTLETGTTTLHDFTFTEDVILQPGEYRAFYSADTRLSLSNSGGQVRLLDPAQVVIVQSDPYGAAADGTAWVLDQADGAWKWSTSTSPNAVNVIAAPIVVAKATKPKAVTVKKATTKVKGTSTTKAKKAKAAKAAKTKKLKTAAAASATSSPVRPEAPIHVTAIAAVAALGVAYMLYEYRHDLGNRFYQLRTNRILRGKAGE